MREDVQKALEQARALAGREEHSKGGAPGLERDHMLFEQLPSHGDRPSLGLDEYGSKLEALCNGLPAPARGLFMRHLAHEGLLDINLDLNTKTLLTLTFILKQTFNGLHGLEVLRGRGPIEVAPCVEPHTLSTYLSIFGLEGVEHLDEQSQSQAKRMLLESELSL